MTDDTATSPTQPHYVINDMRTTKDFTTSTFSNYKKTDAAKSLMKSLIYAKIEDACYWCVELFCSGHVADIWAVFIQFYNRYIHIGNPRIAVYLEHKHRQYELICGKYTMMPIQVRNDEGARRMFAEVICILCDATRKHSLDPIKIAVDDFDLDYLKSRFKAPSMIYAEPIYHKNDPVEFIVAVNEFAYHISSSSRNTIMACYWIEWIHEFDRRFGGAEDGGTRTRRTFTCEPRIFAPVEHKYRSDIIWIVWDVILFTIDEENSPAIQKCVRALLYLYSINYTSGSYKKRKYILYFVVNLLCETALAATALAEPILRPTNREKCAVVIDNIGMIYKQMKQSEQRGGTEYLALDNI
jgi:hypothetical protein